MDGESQGGVALTAYGPVLYLIWRVCAQSLHDETHCAMKSAYDNRSSHPEVEHLGPTCSRFQPQQGKETSSPTHPNLEEEIRRLAFEIYVERDREDDHDLDDWLLAEAEVLAPREHRRLIRAIDKPGLDAKTEFLGQRKK